MTVCEDIIDELEQDTGVAALADDRIFGGVVPVGTVCPFIWVQRRRIEYATEMEAEAVPLKEWFDVECVSQSATEAVELSDAVRACLHGAHGTVGGSTYTWVSVADAAESYVPRNLDAAEYLFISSLDVEVIRP